MEGFYHGLFTHQVYPQARRERILLKWHKIRAKHPRRPIPTHQPSLFPPPFKTISTVPAASRRIRAASSIFSNSFVYFIVLCPPFSTPPAHFLIPASLPRPAAAHLSGWGAVMALMPGNAGQIL